MKIRQKMLILIVCLAIMPMIVFTSALFYVAEFTLQDDFLLERQRLVDNQINKVARITEEFKRDTLILADLPPIQGVIRSRATGFDPEDNSSIYEWYERFQKIASRVIEVNPYVDQVRYLDGQGQEIVRVNNDNGPVAVEESDLQDKSTRPYFTEAAKLSLNEIYVSPIELNVENGEVELPLKPVIRFATPVFSQLDGSFQGVVVINVRANQILSSLEDSYGQIPILANQDGKYLLHPETGKVFSDQLNRNDNLYDDFTDLARQVAQTDSGVYFAEDSDDYLVWQKIKYALHNPTKYWVLYSTVLDEDLFAPLNALRVTAAVLLILTVIIAIISALILSRSITSPINRLTKAMSQYLKDEKATKLPPELTQSDDEMGYLARSFVKLSNEVRTAYRELEKKVKQRTKELASSKKELEKKLKEVEKLNGVMLGRELKMIDLKNKLKSKTKNNAKK